MRLTILSVGRLKSGAERDLFDEYVKRALPVARSLGFRGIDAIEVSAKTGFPEIMGGRVKTLHPRIHGGLLGRRGRPEATSRPRPVSRSTNSIRP